MLALMLERGKADFGRTAPSGRGATADQSGHRGQSCAQRRPTGNGQDFRLCAAYSPLGEATPPLGAAVPFDELEPELSGLFFLA